MLACSDNGFGIYLKLNGNKIFGFYKTFHHRQGAQDEDDYAKAIIVKRLTVEHLHAILDKLKEA